MVQVVHDADIVAGVNVGINSNIGWKYQDEVTTGFGLLEFEVIFGLPVVWDWPVFPSIHDGFVLVKPDDEADIWSTYSYLDPVTAVAMFGWLTTYDDDMSTR